MDRHAADNFLLKVTTMKTMDVPDDISSIFIDIFKDHNVLMFDLTSMENATAIYHYLELAGESLRLEQKLIVPQAHVFDVIVKGERLSLVAVEKFVVVGRKLQNG